MRTALNSLAIYVLALGILRDTRWLVQLAFFIALCNFGGWAMEAWGKHLRGKRKKERKERQQENA